MTQSNDLAIECGKMFGMISSRISYRLFKETPEQKVKRLESFLDTTLNTIDDLQKKNRELEKMNEDLKKQIEELNKTTCKRKGRNKALN